MDEQRVREIVREELAKEAAKKQAAFEQRKDRFEKLLQSCRPRRGVSGYSLDE